MNMEWREPIPFSSAPVPPFPLAALPGCLRDYAADLAEAYQVPTDLPAVLMLAAVAVPLAGRVTVQAGPEWVEPCNLFVAVALPPSNRKSALFKVITAPIVRREERLRTDQGQEYADLNQKRRILTQRIRDLEKKAAKASADTFDALNREISELREQLPAESPPTTLMVDDVTPEKLADLLNANGGRLAIMSAEGGMFENMAGRYSNGIPNLDVYLKGHAGDRVRVDRLNRPTVVIDAPALTIGLAVQPDVLRSLSNKPGLRGRGLLARFLYAAPASLVGRRKLTSAPVHPWARLNYENTVTGLFERLEGVSLRLIVSREAVALLDSFRETIEYDLLPGGRIAYVEDWGGKLAGAVVRIAGILHCAQHGTGDIPREIPRAVMRDAISIGEYFIDHALAVFDLMGADPLIDNAKHVLEWISSRDIPIFTERDVQQALRCRLPTMAVVRPVINLLIEHGYLTRAPSEESRGRGRPASPTFIVNPHLFAHNSHNTQKYAGGP